jgi:D-3-phosphoglycerate dehydrogenase
MLLVFNNDVPGVIGALGTELGRSGVNISRMTVGREIESKQNIIFLGTDQLIPAEVLERVRAIENINGAQSFDL